MACTRTASQSWQKLRWIIKGKLVPFQRLLCDTIVRQGRSIWNEEGAATVPNAVGMGKDVASEIAEEYAEKYCGFSSMVSISQKKKYKKECLSIGKDDCKGGINDAILKYCDKYVDNSYVLKGLKGQCRSRVKDYIDYSLD
eukprot:scaffold2191_cov92-Skeletonema_marinoi.AAC.18